MPKDEYRLRGIKGSAFFESCGVKDDDLAIGQNMSYKCVFFTNHE